METTSPRGMHHGASENTTQGAATKTKNFKPPASVGPHGFDTLTFVKCCRVPCQQAPHNAMLVIVNSLLLLSSIQNSSILGFFASRADASCSSKNLWLGGVRLVVDSVASSPSRTPSRTQEPVERPTPSFSWLAKGVKQLSLNILCLRIASVIHRTVRAAPSRDRKATARNIGGWSSFGCTLGAGTSTKVPGSPLCTFTDGTTSFQEPGVGLFGPGHFSSSSRSNSSRLLLFTVANSNFTLSPSDSACKWRAYSAGGTIGTDILV
jgi:hypothetical protein